jgi:hypothetical protein
MIPIPLGMLSNKDLYGESVIVAGWSKLSENSINPLLQYANLTVLPYNDCTLSVGLTLYHHQNLNELQAICTVADPIVLLNYVSVYFCMIKIYKFFTIGL